MKRVNTQAQPSSQNRDGICSNCSTCTVLIKAMFMFDHNSWNTARVTKIGLPVPTDS